MRTFNHYRVRDGRLVRHNLVVCELVEWGELLVGGEGEGFLKKFRGGFEQDIDEQVKKEKRSGKDDEESKIYCGLNNGEDVDRWKNIALSKKGARSGLSKQRNASLKL
ncbi:hypothetical protein Tco_1240279 [Tanacetum coccineum]